MATRCFSGSLLTLSLLGSALSGGAGCATPHVSADGLPLRRVVVYRNGVGYFERRGLVETAEVKFRVRGSEVGDFLATMAVIEKGGSSVKSASFPLQVEEEPEEPPPDDGNGAFLRSLVPPKKKDPHKLVTVLLSLDGKRHDLSVGYIAETPVWRPSYRLVIQKDGADLQAWGIVQNLSGEDWNGVSLSLVAGAPLAFAATLGTPVIPPRPEVTDRGEVISAMPTSETSLAQGGLVDRDGDGIVDREDRCPDVPGTRRQGGCPEAEGKPSDAPAPSFRTLDGRAKDHAERAEATKAGKPAQRTGARRTKAVRVVNLQEASISGASAAADSSNADQAPGDPSPTSPTAARVEARPDNPSGPRDLSALAAVAVEGSSTRYDIPVLITVPDKSATMVMLLAQRIPGESSFLFAPASGVPDSQAHPFRVARFTNKTGGLLERGPIAVFEDGAFLGQGIVDPLPPDAVATVPFALERAIAIELSTKSGEQGARVAKIEASTLFIERDWSLVTRYVAKNGSEKPARVFVKHARRLGTRLHEPPKDIDDNLGTGSALVPIAVDAQTTGEVSVDERSTTTREVDWLSAIADEAVRDYLLNPASDKIVAADLLKAWTVRSALLRASEEETKLRTEQGELERSTQETRRNLISLEKNPAAAGLRTQLTDRLATSALRLNELSKRLIEVGLELNEQRVRFQEILRGIKLAGPKATP